MNNATERDDGADLRDRIRQSAIEEFGRKGYEAASTNVIVHNAGVSKGLLFHYFGSKKNLYLECTVHVLNTLAKYILESLDTGDTDMFSLLRRALEKKLRFYKDNPEFMGLAGRVWYSDNRAELEERLPQYAVGYKTYNEHPLFKNADRSRLRDGLEFSTVVEYTALLLEACWLRFSARYHDDTEKIAEHIDEYLAEVDITFDLIKEGAYKG